jgi:hypothetical protein
MDHDEKIQAAIKNTVVLRPPRQQLATFGATNISYYMITELLSEVNVVREGRVIAARPRIVTPSYLINVDGFSGSARRYIQMIAEQNPHEPGILYSYKNEFGDMNIISDPLDTVMDNINRRIESQGEPLSAIIKGVEDMWDVSLMKFTFELTRNSVQRNISELYSRGRFHADARGVPQDAVDRIEELFALAANDTSYAGELANELRYWNLWEGCQDRFMQLFKGRR